VAEEKETEAENACQWKGLHQQKGCLKGRCYSRRIRRGLFGDRKIRKINLLLLNLQENHVGRAAKKEKAPAPKNEIP